MGKIDPKDYRSSSDMLSADDIEEAAILTISSFSEGERKDKDGKWALLKFEETGDKILFLNNAALETLVDRYGDNTDDWVGQIVPVEAYEGTKGPAVRIMAAEEWDNAFTEAGVEGFAPKTARPAPRAVATRTPAKVGGRKVVKKGGRARR
jgi:hypothetical protein